MGTHGSIVPSQSSLVEPRINKRRDRSPSEISDGRADAPEETPLLIEETPHQIEETPLQSEETPLIKNLQWIS